MAVDNAEIKNFTQGLIGSLNRVTTGFAFKQSGEIIKANERMKDSQERLARRQSAHQDKVVTQQEKYEKSREKIAVKHASNQTQRDIELFKLDNRRNASTKELVDDFDTFKKSLQDGVDLEKEHITNLKSEGSMNSGFDGMSAGLDNMTKGIEGLTFGIVDLSGGTSKLTNFFKGLISLGAGLIGFLGSLGETIVMLTDHMGVFERKTTITRKVNTEQMGGGGGDGGGAKFTSSPMGSGDMLGGRQIDATAVDTISSASIQSSQKFSENVIGKATASIGKGFKNIGNALNPKTIAGQFADASKGLKSGISDIIHLTPSNKFEKEGQGQLDMEMGPPQNPMYMNDSVPKEAAAGITDMLNGVKNALISVIPKQIGGSATIGGDKNTSEFGPVMPAKNEARDMMNENFDQMKGHAENYKNLLTMEGSSFDKLRNAGSKSLQKYGETVNGFFSSIGEMGKSTKKMVMSMKMFGGDGFVLSKGLKSFGMSAKRVLMSALKFIPAVLGFVVATTMFAVSMIVASLPFIAMGLLIALGVALLVAAVVAVFNKFPIIGETLKSVFGFVFDVITSIVSNIMDVFGNMWQAVKDVFGGFFDMFSAAFQGDFGGVVDGFFKIVTGIFDFMFAPLRKIGSLVGDFVESLLPEWAANMLTGRGTESAEESGLYNRNSLLFSTIDESKIAGASSNELQEIIKHNDLNEDDMKLVKAEMEQRNKLSIGDRVLANQGTDLDKTRKEGQAASEKSTAISVATNQNNSSSVSNSVFNQIPNVKPFESSQSRTSTLSID